MTIQDQARDQIHNIKNPFRPGAGHMPPYLAGRENEKNEFIKLLDQDVILENLVLTGLRGVGKTVLLETFHPIAVKNSWLWARADLSEAASLSEDSLAIRLLTDLSVVTTSLLTINKPRLKAGFANEIEYNAIPLNYSALMEIYNQIPGLVLDKLKGVLEWVWLNMKTPGIKGIVFAYDEAQNLDDHAAKDQRPLSMLLDVFQSIQRKNIPFMLVLTGLPTLFPKLVEARTYAERMFRVIALNSLNEDETFEAIRKPVSLNGIPFGFSNESARLIWKATRGYPYFIQYFCRETFDVWVQATLMGQFLPSVPINEIERKLDSDFFAGRWSRATDRQRELLSIIAQLPEGEFSLQEVVEHFSNKALEKRFGSSQISQMLVALSEAGLTFKSRYGKYSLAVPLLGDFISRQMDQNRTCLV